ncbi:beta-ketoacyl synthase [Micromonospora sp. HUAS LYJ1]|uniref:beta-ketoacyl-[acyl-carrier-protein] synthase family protein n=1 Tax=Micromonospora sp. HUAS LYJ1 TaxID=3061626 RepID=UPI002673BFFB|nr:beta-ketoacyl-[acyl-carrier-protein] synthase family protein [Micromonospora sp. HUAS LYJ1]WKU02990.1 beta-ketoacyl-[acyl-carrier-protein] synthase family protein [Micromonospora sp. HUAS LYJ1]
MSEHADQVLITGIGAIAAGASGVDTFWSHLRDGVSQISTVDRFVAEDLPAWIGGEITGFDPFAALPERAHRFATRQGRETLIAMASTSQALADAGLAVGAVAPDRISMIGACSRGPLGWWSDTFAGADRSGSRSPILQSLPGAPVSLAAIVQNIQGLVTTISNGCVSGHQAIGLGWDALQWGQADLVIVTGYEFPLVPALIRAFGLMGEGALCRQRDASGAMKPYDRARDGFVLGEAAIALCLERASSVRRRGGRGYAEILGHRSRNEAAHPMTMDLTGQHGSLLIEDTLKGCGRTADDIGYICGHGSATRYNDLAEGRILQALYPDRPPHQRPPLGSVKPIYGHTLGACGTLNVAAVALMLHHQRLAPTINCVDPDPECGSDHVLDGPRSVAFEVGISLAMGLGSQSSVVALGPVR